MPKLRLYEFEFTLIDATRRTDNRGKDCLLARGYHKYNSTTIKGNQFKAYDSFSTIVLYGSSQLLDETQHRLLQSKDNKIILDIIDSDITTRLKGKHLICTLLVYFYDFKINRFGTRKLIRKLQKGSEIDE